MNTLKNVINEAKLHFLANGRTGDVMVVKNDNGVYYCESSSLRQLHLRDSENGLNPVVCGNWSNDTFLGIDADMGYSYHSTTDKRKVMHAVLRHYSCDCCYQPEHRLW